MSEYLGAVQCPRCGDPERAFEVRDWLTYLSVVCAGCDYKVGELDTRSAPGTLSAVLSQRDIRDAANLDAEPKGVQDVVHAYRKQR